MAGEGDSIAATFLRWSLLNACLAAGIPQLGNILTLVIWRKSEETPTSLLLLVAVPAVVCVIAAVAIFFLMQKLILSMERSLSISMEKLARHQETEDDSHINTLLDFCRRLEVHMNDIRSLRTSLEFATANGSFQLRQGDRHNPSLEVPSAAPRAHSSETRTPSALDMSPIELNVTSQQSQDSPQGDIADPVNKSMFSKAFRVFQYQSMESPLPLRKTRFVKPQVPEASTEDKEPASTAKAGGGNSEQSISYETTSGQEHNVSETNPSNTSS